MTNANSAEPIIRIEHVWKFFGELPALQDVSLHVYQGQRVVIIGPSGSGKSTLLRSINRLEEINSGLISVDGIDVNDPKNDINKIRQNLGMVFQQFNLFPHLTVRENIKLAPVKLKVMTDEEADKRALELLARVGLPDKADSYPAQLSGGQQQRIALARALVISPDVLLMDEPLSNLDAKLRVEMRSVIRHTQKSVGITTVYVTHDQEEAMAISDRIAVMKEGVIQHVGTPRDIYQRPKNVFVATFIGRTNIVNAHVKDGIITFADGYHEHIDALDKAAEQDVRCSIRPEEFIICKDGTDGIHGTVQECTYLGLNTHYTIDTDQGDSVEIVEESSIGEGLKKGEKVLLKVKKEKINVFTKDGGTNLIRSDAYEKQ